MEKKSNENYNDEKSVRDIIYENFIGNEIKYKGIGYIINNFDIGCFELLNPKTKVSKILDIIDSEELQNRIAILIDKLNVLYQPDKDSFQEKYEIRDAFFNPKEKFFGIRIKNSFRNLIIDIKESHNLYLEKEITKDDFELKDYL